MNVYLICIIYVWQWINTTELSFYHFWKRDVNSFSFYIQLTMVQVPAERQAHASD